ncbi:MAG: DNA polymerase III subunit chi [Parvibaculaceae bacterium]
MTEILFYHMQNAPLEQVLPQLLEASLKREWRAVVKVGEPARLDEVNTQLWTHRPSSFLPHGTSEDGPADTQPVYLTTQDENPNAAQVLFLVHGATPANLETYTRCVLMFDGRNEVALAAARVQWKSLKAEGHDATYWQQSEEGRWEKKA